jgi:hypothetical protein
MIETSSFVPEKTSFNYCNIIKSVRNQRHKYKTLSKYMCNILIQHQETSRYIGWKKLHNVPLYTNFFLLCGGRLLYSFHYRSMLGWCLWDPSPLRQATATLLALATLSLLVACISMLYLSLSQTEIGSPRPSFFSSQPYIVLVSARPFQRATRGGSLSLPMEATI